MSEALSVSTAFTPAPFVVVRKRMASRSDGRPGTKNDNSYAGGSLKRVFIFEANKDYGRDYGRTHPFIGCVSVRPFSPSPPG
jgi:hypothetical protein